MKTVNRAPKALWIVSDSNKRFTLNTSPYKNTESALAPRIRGIIRSWVARNCLTESHSRKEINHG